METETTLCFLLSQEMVFQILPQRARWIQVGQVQLPPPKLKDSAFSRGDSRFRGKLVFPENEYNLIQTSLFGRLTYNI